MDRKPWTVEEVEFLTRGSASLTSVQLAAQLGRPLKMVRWKAGKLGIKLIDGRRDGTGVPRTLWSEDRVTFLRKYAADRSATRLAADLGLSELQVRRALDYYEIPGRGVARKQDPEHIEKRVAPLRGVEKVDRGEPRPCRDCGDLCPPFAFPSERGPGGTQLLCDFCRIIRRHGITGKQARQMIAEQGNRCRTCKRSFEETRAVLDHDHAHCPGTFGCSTCARGFLCNRCNQIGGALEQLERDPELEAAFEIYLHS